MEKIENLMREHEKINDAFYRAFPRTFELRQDKEPATIYGHKNTKVHSDLKKPTATFDREKKEVIFRFKVEDRITADKITEEEDEHAGKSRCDSRK